MTSRLSLVAAGLLILGALPIAAWMGNPIPKGTPITVGDGSIHLKPGKVLNGGEWDTIGAGVKKKRGGGKKINSVTATGSGVTTTPTATCDPKANCTLTVTFRGIGESPEFATVTVASDAGTKGVHLASSIDWAQFAFGDDEGAKGGKYEVIAAEFTSGTTVTKLCSGNNSGSRCAVTVDWQ